MARNGHGGERGATTLEYVAATGLALVLTAGVATRFEHGHELGVRVAARLEELVAGTGGRTQVPARDGGGPFAALPSVAGSGTALPRQRSVRWVQEHRVGDARPGDRVSRDDLRLSPVLPRTQAWGASATRRGTTGGASWRGDARACLACTELTWRGGLVPGAAADARGGGVGGSAQIEAETHVALFATELAGTVRRALGPATLSGAARLRGVVGADADVRLGATLTSHRQAVEVRGGAMAGAAARGETKLGIRLLGIFVEQSARGEVWAGAGARAHVGATHTSSRITWDIGWGGALGLGGAAEWSGSVDVSRVSKQHRRVARVALHAATHLSDPGVADTVLHSIRHWRRR